MNQTLITIKPRAAETGDFLITSPIEASFLVSSDKNGIWHKYKSKLEYYKLIKLINNIQDIIINDNNIFEFLNYKGLSLWQFVIPFIQPIILRQMEIIDMIVYLNETFKPSRYTILPFHDDTNKLWVETIKSTFTTLNIQFAICGTKKSNRKKNKFVDYPPKINKYNVPFSKKIKKILFDSIISNGREKKKVKILAISQFRNWIYSSEKPQQKYDDQFSKILDRVCQNDNTVAEIIDCVDFSLLNLFQFLIWSWRSNNEEIIRIPLYLYPENNDINLNRIQMVMSELFSTLCSSQEFRNKLTYRGICLLPGLKNDLEITFLKFLPMIVKTLSMVDSVFQNEEPDCVASSFEAIGVAERLFIIKAHELGIPSIGLQHGMIFDNHYHYMHKNIITSSGNGLNGFVRPTITCVWGATWKKILTENGHYPKSSVKITGNWKYDNFKLLSDYEKSIEKIRLGIPINKKIVLLISGNQNVGSFLRKCIDVILDFPDLYPMIKLHPIDKIDLSHKICQGIKLSQYEVKDLYINLLIADIVITQFSTVVSEALLLNKKIILTNFENLHGWDKYTNTKALLYTTDPKELPGLISNCINMKFEPHYMIEDRKKFINNYFYLGDDKASHRVANIINELIIK